MQAQEQGRAGTGSAEPAPIAGGFIGRPTLRALFGDVSIYRTYQEAFLETAGPRLSGDVIEIGGENHYRNARFFPNATSYTVSNIDRDYDIRLDATDLPFDDDERDAYVCVSVLNHVPDVERAVAEMYRTLRPGGLLLATVPFLYPVCDTVDFRRWTPHGTRELFGDFEIVDLVHLGGKISTVVSLLQRPRKNRARRHLATKSFGALLTLTLGRHDQRDGSPIGLGVLARKPGRPG